MNKLPDAKSRRSPASEEAPAPRRRAAARKRTERPRVLPRIRTFDDLPSTHERFMRAAASRSVEITDDPLEPGALRERHRRGGVTVAGPRHERLVGEDLVVAGLVEWKPGDPSIIALTDAGFRYWTRRRQVYEARMAAEIDLARADLEDGWRERPGLEPATVEVGGEAAEVLRNPAESPLAWLARRRGKDGERLIGPAAFAAGERLRRDITLAGMMPSTTMRWSAAPVSRGAGGRGPAEATDAMIAAGQRVRHALDAVGPDDAGLLMDVCGFLKGLETIERERRWAPRSAKVMLRVALTRLAAHYGLEDEAEGRESRGIRVWREEGEPGA